ncbi:MAG: MFS transporter [Xanthobacteraceae bacterium]|nr:MFS transporter [Xanthobacteraceae bacterium]
MFQKLADHIRNSDVDYPLLVPLLLSSFLVQTVTALVRVTISYRAVELELSLVWLGMIAATFAIFPILIAVQVGRFIDRGYDTRTAWIGALIFALSMTGFALWPTTAGLLLFSTVMGFGHIMLMASHQMICVRAAGPKSLETVFGNFMVVTAIGQGFGPYVVGWMGGSAPIPPTRPLFVIAAALAAASLVFALMMKPARTAAASKNQADIVPISQILRIPGLVAVVAAGVIMVAASDTVVVYIPLLGAERNIDVHDIGLLLTVRAAASMVARLFYARMVAAFGRWPLMIAGTFVCGLSYAAIAAPIPLWAMHVAIAAMGFSFGLATTLSITIVVDMTTVSARGTTNSLRIMSNRIGQFAMPFGAGLVAAAAGLGGLFLVLAAAIVTAAGSMVWKRPGR